jgi:alkanesulfonate monooxygenase SsuD/methylene tetrahydromethanopterin reductase-like flavin-dependent oxidoreductase (luciferase family)
MAVSGALLRFALGSRSISPQQQAREDRVRLGLLTGMGSDWRDSLEKIKVAEDLGYEMVVSPEAWGISSLPFLAVLATNTSKIQIGTSIVNCFSRTPAALAQEFGALDVLSGGRMVLGLGSSAEYVVEHFHGMPFKKPLRRIREYVEIFNTLISGEKLNYDGEIFKLQRGFRLDYDRPRDHIPVYLAAITAKSIHQTGEVADGLFPIHWPAHQLGVLRAQLDEGARAAGRAPSALDMAVQTYHFVLDGTNDEEQWRAARRPLWHYINRMGDFYWQMLQRNGFEAEVEASRTAWANRDAEGALMAISEDMVREIEVIGPIESVQEQLRERARLGAELQLLHMPRGDVRQVGRELEALIR